MGHRYDEVRGREGQSWRDRAGFTASRHWNREEDMGGSSWSGASGRGGMGYDERSCRGSGTTNEAYGGRGSGAWGHGHGGYGGQRYPSESYESRVVREPYREPHPEDFGERGRDMRDMHGIHDVDPGPFYRTGPKGYRRSDERIREDVCEVIAEQGYIDARDVEVLVDDGIVKLVGTVVHRHDRRVLEHMIDHVRGIEEIHNELRLRREDRLVERTSPPSNGHRARM